MVRKAAELASAEDVAELRAIVEQQRAVTGDAAAFVHADMGFHTRIAQITGNPIYSAVSEGMLGWLQEYHAHMLIWQGQSERTLTEHGERSEERRVGNECGSTCRSRGWPYD